MKGMEMMMKALGFEPEKLQAEISKAGEEYKRVVKHFDDQLNVILANQAEILKRLPETQPKLELIEGGKDA